MIFVWILLSIAAAIIIWLVFWSFISFLSLRSAFQKQFSEGKLPSQKPEGFYKGAAYLVPLKNVPWLGKSFSGAKDLGFNIFNPKGAKLLKILTPLYKLFSVNSEGNTNAYNFITFVGKGLKDKDLQVIKLDYDAPENPFLIRIILDEIVEIAPEEFLGKVHLKIFPRVYSTIGYFGLKKLEQTAKAG